MIRMSWLGTFGAVVTMALPIRVSSQMVGRSTTPPPTMGVRPPSSQPTIRMGSLPPRVTPYGFGRRYDGRLPFGAPIGQAPCFDARFSCIGTGRHFYGAYSALPYVIQTPVPYEVPVYVPVPVWTAPLRTAPSAPPKPYDPTRSRMLTIGGGADGGGGVMRIEQLEGKVLRLTWHGTTQPVKEARFFLADSSRATLRSARVDAETPSALFELAGVEPRVAYIGLTVAFADGAVQTTLIPYPPAERTP